MIRFFISFDHWHLFLHKRVIFAHHHFLRTISPIAYFCSVITIIPEYIFMPDGTIAQGKALSVDNDGVIINMFDIQPFHDDRITHRGLILPGFVNAHMHLELSWCHQLIPPQCGMETFFSYMKGVHEKKPHQSKIDELISHELEAAHQLGLEAAADICNTSLTFQYKDRSPIYFHSFLEVFGTNPANSEVLMENASKLKNEVRHKNSYAAHTLFTLSSKLSDLLFGQIAKNGEMHSIHFMESDEELMFFKNHVPVNHVHSTPVDMPRVCNHPVDEAIRVLPQTNRVVFVHNTLTTLEDAERITNHFDDAWFCLCPRSNQYITGKLPDAGMFFTKFPDRVVLGTDSLASNYSLELLPEADALLAAFPGLTLEMLLQALTMNGARFLGIDRVKGSLSKGKKPGIIWLEQYHPGLRNIGSLKPKRLF